MPRRRTAKARTYRRRRRGLPAPKNFINTLGGWGTNRAVKHYDERTFVTPLYTGPITEGVTNTILRIFLSDIPVDLRNVYQRLRIKKVEVFTSWRLSGDENNNAIIQAAIAPAKNNASSQVARSIPGAQVKIMSVHTNNPSQQQYDLGVSDILRCARFYPPVDNIDNGDYPNTRQNWIGTNASPTDAWTCFFASFQGTNQAMTLEYYFRLTLLMDGQKFNLTTSEGDTPAVPMMNILATDSTFRPPDTPPTGTQ